MANIMTAGHSSGEMIVDSNGNSVVKDGTQSALIDPVYVDVEFVYSITDSLVTFGGSNIFDKYVNTIDAPNANRMNMGLPYQGKYTNYEGS